jgi:hypothetical protein
MCVLRVTGKEFDADKYLALSGLSAIKVFHLGEPRFKSRPAEPAKNPAVAADGRLRRPPLNGKALARQRQGRTRGSVSSRDECGFSKQ